MLKLLALGAIGYLGYRYLQKQGDTPDANATAIGTAPVAGGALSTNSVLQANPNVPPEVDPYRGVTTPPPAG